MLQRFGERGKQDIEKMLLGELPDLRETQAGKDLIAIGVEVGIESGIERGREQGPEEGIEKGLNIGTIRTCQSILGVELTNDVELRTKSIVELSKIADELQALVKNRFGHVIQPKI